MFQGTHEPLFPGPTPETDTGRRETQHRMLRPPLLEGGLRIGLKAKRGLGGGGRGVQLFCTRPPHLTHRPHTGPHPEMQGGSGQDGSVHEGTPT